MSSRKVPRISENGPVVTLSSHLRDPLVTVPGTGGGRLGQERTAGHAARHGRTPLGKWRICRENAAFATLAAERRDTSFGATPGSIDH